MIHTCGAVAGFRLVLDDAGTPTIIRWCHHCNASIADGPPIDRAEVPPDLLAALIRTGHDNEGTQ